jgi:predicted nucleic acid-binding protein
MIRFGTNILVYAADGGAGERHGTAVDLLERSIRRGNCIQTLQSLCEFFCVVTRKSGIDAGAAAALVDGWRSVMLVEAASRSSRRRAHSSGIPALRRPARNTFSKRSRTAGVFRGPLALTRAIVE